jgi:hypothetical protein
MIKKIVLGYFHYLVTIEYFNCQFATLNVLFFRAD